MESARAGDGRSERATRTKLLVLFGGRSAEHDVSRVTASHVLRAVDPLRYEVTAIGIGRDGRWQLAEGAMAALAEGPDALPDALEVAGPTVEALPSLRAAASTDSPPDSLVSPPDSGLEAPVDAPVVVLPLLHGPFGEDGTVQGLLEL